MPLKLFDSSFAMKKGSPYTLFLKNEIKTLRESGMVQIIMRRYDDLKQKKCDSKCTSEEENSLSYQKVIFPFLIVLCGMFFACITLGIENMIF